MPQNTAPSSERSSENHIPPPQDPFPTYQVPYSRQSSEAVEQNPFVLFKQFADSQLSSFLSGVSSLFDVPRTNVDTSSRIQNASAEFEAALKHSFDKFNTHFAAMDEQLSIMTRRHKEAEGSWKQLEQEREERRMRNIQANQCPALPDEADNDLDLFDAISEFIEATQKEMLNPNRFNTASEWEARISDTMKQQLNALTWYVNDPYSPFQLGNRQDGISTRLDWESAFLDLIDKTESADRDGFGQYNNSEVTKWRQNFSKSLKDGPALLAATSSLRGSPTQQSDSRWASDLNEALAKDWPSVWLGKSSSRDDDQPLSVPLVQKHDWSLSTGERNGGNPVVSTMTTTHTRTLPDGSIETQRTVKRNFADGRQECDDSSEVYPSISASTTSARASTNSQDTETEATLQQSPVQQPTIKQEARKAGQGWFWN